MLFAENQISQICQWFQDNPQTHLILPFVAVLTTKVDSTPFIARFTECFLEIYFKGFCFYTLYILWRYPFYAEGRALQHCATYLYEKIAACSLCVCALMDSILNSLNQFRVVNYKTMVLTSVRTFEKALFSL